MKRAAEIFTQAIFRNEAAAKDCAFALDAHVQDKFGKPKTLEGLIRWRFTRAQADKVDWDKLDPRDFQSIALDYRFSKEIDDWTSDEPSMTADRKTVAASLCKPLLFRANAIFIRSTTFCSTNFMDSRAGYKALAGAKQCQSMMNETTIKSAMMEVDQKVRERGKGGACRWVSDLAAEVIKAPLE